MDSPIDRVMETEVLVVGGSGAGVTAAIQAHRMGRRTLLVSKGKVGRSGNAIMAGGGFGVDGYSARHIIGEAQADERYTREKYFDNIVKEGFLSASRSWWSSSWRTAPRQSGSCWSGESGQTSTSPSGRPPTGPARASAGANA